MDWLDVSKNAGERWLEVTDSPGIGPVVAWNEAERRQVRDLRADEVRYHRPTDTLLLAHGTTLVEVMDATSANRQIRQDVFGSGGEPA